MGKTPVSQEKTISIWNALRQRFSFQPAQFKSRKQLISALKKEKDWTVKVATTRDFYRYTREFAKEQRTRAVKVRLNVRIKGRMRWRSLPDYAIRGSKVMITHKRKDGKRQVYWHKIY